MLEKFLSLFVKKKKSTDACEYLGYPIVKTYNPHGNVFKGYICCVLNKHWVQAKTVPEIKELIREKVKEASLHNNL